MKILKALGTTARVGGTLVSYLTYRVVTDPKASRQFIETLANTIVDFRPEPRPRLKVAGLDELFPGIDQASTQPLNLQEGEWELPPAEYASLAKIIAHLQPRTVFEIGTFRGRTTLLIARHAPKDAAIHTLDLRPEETRQRWGKSPELIGQAFRDHPAKSKITQLYTDDRTFDFRPFYGAMDLIFIDGNHRYEAVKRDTIQAMQMITPGGVILWDDYQLRQPGVMHCVNELGRRVSGIAQIQGTRFACYRAPRQ